MPSLSFPFSLLFASSPLYFHILIDYCPLLSLFIYILSSLLVSLIIIAGTMLAMTTQRFPLSATDFSLSVGYWLMILRLIGSTSRVGKLSGFAIGGFSLI